VSSISLINSDAARVWVDWWCSLAFTIDELSLAHADQLPLSRL